MHFIDILFFAAIAAFLIHKLYGVLGQRRGNEKPEGFEFMSKDAFKELGKGGKGSQMVGKMVPRNTLTEKSNQKPREKLNEEDINLLKKHPILKEFRKEDPTFTPTAFLKGASIAFEKITAAFHNGSLKSVRSLLSASVNESFTKALSNNKNDDKKSESPTLVSLKAEINKAELEKNSAQIIVTFHSEQITDGKTNKARDKWIFLRHLKSRNPNWVLASCG